MPEVVGDRVGRDRLVSDDPDADDRSVRSGRLGRRLGAAPRGGRRRHGSRRRRCRGRRSRRRARGGRAGGAAAAGATAPAPARRRRSVRMRAGPADSLGERPRRSSSETATAAAAKTGGPRRTRRARSLSPLRDRLALARGDPQAHPVPRGPRSPRAARRAPAISSSETGSSTCFWIARRSGRAPMFGIVAALREQPLDGRVVDVDPGALGRERRVDVVDQEPADPGELRRAPSGWKTMISSMRLMNSGEKSLPQLLQHEVLDLLRCSGSPSCRRSPSRLRLTRCLRPDVGRHDDERVLEVDEVAVGVRQDAVLEDLEQQVGDVRMRLLDLVEEDHAVGIAADALGELAALLVADVARAASR